MNCFTSCGTTKSEDLKKLVHFNEIPKMLGVDGEYPAGQSAVKSILKYPIEKSILFSFVNL